MRFTWTFLMDGALLGFGLAMDAFSVSVVNGLRNPAMKRKQMIGIAAVFGLFQAAMPLIGWVLVRTALDLFHPLKKIVPGAAFCILAVIGIKMLLKGIRGNEQEAAEETGTGGLMLQGLATSIDALSAGLTMAELSVAPLCRSRWLSDW